VTWTALLWHYELPRFTGTGLCDYSVGNGPANWATAAAIAQTEAAARLAYRQGLGRVALGDVGLEHGGRIDGHASHRVGLDVDVRPIRKARDQCSWGTNWRSTTYDRAATRALIKAIQATASGHVKVIYFNDPVLIKEGLTRWYEGHEDHLHIRYCEAWHPSTAYRC
jgi:murein endopeptidase